MTIWRRYLLAGLVASAVCAALPVGVGRDIAYCLIGLSSAAAILVGVRRNRPTHPAVWYLVATGTATWALADILYGWYQQPAQIAPLPSLGNVLYLAAYPLFAAALLLLVGRRHDTLRGPDELEDTAIVTVSVGLLAWVFLVEPIWTAAQVPLSNRLVGVAYPFCDVLLLALLMRLTTSTRVRNPTFLLVTGSVGALLVCDSVLSLIHI